MHKNNELFLSRIAKNAKNTCRGSPALPTAGRYRQGQRRQRRPLPPGRLPFAIRRKRPCGGPAIKKAEGYPSAEKVHSTGIEPALKASEASVLSIRLRVLIRSESRRTAFRTRDMIPHLFRTVQKKMRGYGQYSSIQCCVFKMNVI